MNLKVDRVAWTWVCLIGSMICVSSMQAQIVRLLPGGGVNVRAPFVRVNVDGAGNTHVRAPFVNIQAPGQGIPNQRFPNQVIPGQSFPNRFDPNQPAPGEFVPNRSGNSVSGVNPVNGQSASQFYRGQGNRQPGNKPQPATISATQPNRLDGTVSVLVRNGGTVKSKPSASVLPISQMDWRQLRKELRTAASSLDQVLAKSQSGNSLKRKLRPGTIRDLLAEDLESMPDSETMNQLNPIWNQFELIAATNPHPEIVGSPEFGRMRSLLSEMVTEPLDRQRRLVASSATRLEKELARFRTGKDWQKFLQLPEFVFESKPANPETLSKHRESLIEMASRYQKTQTNPNYRAVTDLASFQTTRQLLSEYAKQLSLRAKQAPEALPRPQRDKKRID